MVHVFRRSAFPLLPCVLLTVGARSLFAAELPSFDFRQASVVAQWRAANDVGAVRATPDGMEVAASGNDPFLVGPAVDVPAGTPLALEMKVRSERGGEVEVFYFTDHARAGKSVSARVAPGVWEDLRLPLPPLNGRTTFRIDPPAPKGGSATVASMALRRRAIVKEPQWPKPPTAPHGEPIAVVRSGNFILAHSGAPAGVELRIGEHLMARGAARSLIGYIVAEEARWMPVAERADVRKEAETVVEVSTQADSNGGTWRVERRYRAGAVDGSIDVETVVSVDRDRELVFFPAFILLPGTASFGAHKSQAVFCGLEYLGRDDASSSEADVIGPAARRKVPDALKVTVPLMAVAAGGRYVGLSWEPQAAVAAAFDSPDRTFGSGGHVMGLVLPGSDGRSRIDGELLPELPHRIKANAPVVVKATIFGGVGDSVVPALKQHVALRGLPPTPAIGMDAGGYSRWAAGGWLDSKIREGSLVRHALWPGFGPQRSADAAVWMRWLATQTDDVSLRNRLTETAATVASEVPPAQYNTAAVAHVRYPVASLVLGHTLDNARAADAQARELLKRFEPDGSVVFQREAGKDDFARTSSQPVANGLTATHASRLLDLAAVSGDRELIDASLRLLRNLDRYRDDVPRGAQSWEVPLHTPDILASAWLVRAYVTGFELTGDRELLDHATYWAWTGVPFVYLRSPVDARVGPYATIAVYGATNWVAPVWFGQPVQWCGLVYADALYQLARHDAPGPWKQLADGITASGVQQSWPSSDSERQGLLPDFYHVRAQISDGPAINPGTLQANAVRLFGGPRVYDFHRFVGSGVIAHVPGTIEPLQERGGRVTFRVRGWPDGPYQVLVSGLRARPRVLVNGAEPPVGDVRSFDAAGGRLALTVTGNADVEITPAP